MWLSIRVISPTEKARAQVKIWLKTPVRNQPVTHHMLMMQNQATTETCGSQSLLEKNLLVLAWSSKSLMAAIVGHHLVLQTFLLMPNYKNHDRRAPRSLRHKTSKKMLAPSEELFSDLTRQEVRGTFSPSLNHQKRHGQSNKLRVSESLGMMRRKRKRWRLMETRLCWATMLSGAGWTHRMK